MAGLQWVGPGRPGKGRRPAGMWPGGRPAGFTLLELAMVALVLTLGGVWVASRWQNQVDDAAAEATAAYLLTLRGATQSLLVRHFDHLAGYPVTPGRPAVPAYLQGASPWQLSVADLQQFGPDGAAPFLSTGSPLAPPLGESVAIRIAQQGICPGEECRLTALVHTQAPLRLRDDEAYRPELVGAVMMATQGYGGHAPPGQADRLRGALFDVPNPLGAVAGIVAVVADLETTHFAQFVRQGDTRAVWLQNQLSVQGLLRGHEGLHLATAALPGASCTQEAAYALAATGSLVQCLAGFWFELNRYVVQGRRQDLRDGDPLPQPACPPGLLPFRHLTLQQPDVAVAGSAIDVRGTVGGSLAGAGSADANGQVTIAGSFSGELQSTPDSRIDITQSITEVGGLVRVQDAGPLARVSVIYGCHHV